MQRGLEGRRIAAYADEPSGDGMGLLARALEQAGAPIHQLRDSDADGDWHGAKYAALVVVGPTEGDLSAPPRLVQLVREFLVSEKPIAAHGSAVSAIVQAGGAAGRTLAGRGSLETEGGTRAEQPVHVDGCLVTGRDDVDMATFAARVVREFSAQLDEHEADAMVDQSFPASDPPSTSPASIGHLAPDADRDARP